MDIGSVMEAWDEVETESDNSEADVCMDELDGDLSEEESSGPVSNSSAGPSTRRRRQHVEYNWEEISDGKKSIQS